MMRWTILRRGPGKPNMFGLIQGERNAVQPGKRPLSSMTPTIVLRKDGSVWFALGARGGPRIISAVMQSVINVIDHDMNIQAAIDAPASITNGIRTSCFTRIRLVARHQADIGAIRAQVCEAGRRGLGDGDNDR